MAYANLGNAYWSQGDFSKAIKYHGQDLAIAKEVGDRAGGQGAREPQHLPHALERVRQSRRLLRSTTCYVNIAEACTRAVRSKQRSTWVSSPFASTQLARALLLVLTKLLDRIVARRHRRAWMIECVMRQSAAALRINLNVEGCGIVAVPVYDPSRAPLLLPCVH
jgi:hypothetical protein